MTTDHYPYGFNDKELKSIVVETIDLDFLSKFCEENNFRFCDIHSLRHFYASALINEGVDAATVSGALGHSTITTTTSIYCHVFNQAQARAGDAIASVLDFKKHDKGKGQPEAV